MSAGSDREADVHRYDALARALTEGGLINDPWIDGSPRFDFAPIVLSEERWHALASVAERVAAVYNEVCTIVRDEPAHLDTFFCMTPWQKAMWAASQPHWHGIARADLFFTSEGISVAELNCDTPTGEPEAVELGRIARAGRPDCVDPNVDLEASFASLVRSLASRELDRPLGESRTVGIVYPTEFTEDLSLVRLYRKWLQARGHEVVLGSPYNLSRLEDGSLALFDTRIDVMLRHYKTDWWGERQSAWDDETLSDEEALGGPLAASLEASLERKVSIVNPFGSVLPQNKRSMAFMWEMIHVLSAEAQSIVERHVPVTSRFENVHGEQLAVQKDEWVLKSDYGAEGEEVTVGRAVDAEAWRLAIEHARRGRWIAQRYFEAETDADGRATNYGVYVVAGRAVGIYARTQRGPTDARALSRPVLVAR